jgi:alkyl hydroperoxide reductase subunit F
MKGILNAEPTEVFGEKFVKGMKYKDKATGEIHTLNTPGIFVEVGMIASTDFVKDLVTLNKAGKIQVDPKTQMSSRAGVWAAGDCTDGLYHQNNIAVGDAVKAIEDMYLHLKTL